MNSFIVITFLVVAPLVLIFGFSFAIILSAMNKKNIKLNLFAFRFNLSDKIKGKLAKPQAMTTAAVTGEIVVTDEATDTAYAVIPEPNAPAEIKPAEASVPIVFDDEPNAEEPLEMADVDYDDLDLIEDIDSNAKIGSRTTMLMGGMKDRIVQAQNDAQARAIEREERKLQEDLELYDPDETLEEMPDDFGGKLGYWWRNNFGFRVGTCALAVFLVFALVFYGFQMRVKLPTDGDVTQIAATNEEDNAEKDTELDPELEKFRQTLDGELAPVDVEADSLDEDPNLAEIVTTAQRQVGTTPSSYAGSNTTTQPSGSIGTISIPSINLKNAPVMGSVELSDLAKGTGHFENTPVFDGNVGIAGHNNTHFKYLVNVDIGDQIQYKVNGVTRTYQVTDMRAISDTDWGVFTDYGDNRLTLVTCEHLVPNSRIAVTAIQVGSDSGVSNGRVYTGKTNSSFHQDSGDYHDAGSGYTDYIGVFTGNN